MAVDHKIMLMLLIFDLFALRSQFAIIEAPFLLLSSSDKKLDAQKSEQLRSGNIIFGAGYSRDKQQVTTLRCYNASVGSIGEQEMSLELGTVYTYSKLLDKLGLSANIHTGFLMFSTDATATYMRSLQDNDYAFSLNYYVSGTTNVAVQIGQGLEALNERGRKFYINNHTSFGLACGDCYISSYKQGAMLTMGLKIELSNSSAKEEFGEKISGSLFGDIAGLAGNIKKIAANSELGGMVTLHAFQKGGEPNRLANILSKDSSGHYHAISCSLQEMDECAEMASGLLEYARNDFANKQLSFTNNTGLVPLGLGFTTYDSIDLIGLNPPPTLITKEIEQYREELAYMFNENQYYQQKFYPLMHGSYPIKLNDYFIKKIQLLSDKVDNNMRLLTQPHSGAAQCYDDPRECKKTKVNIDSHRRNITKDDLKFLESIKYSFCIKGYNPHFNDGGIDYKNSWFVNVYNKIENMTFSVDEKTCFIEFDGIDSDNSKYHYKFIGNLSSHISNRVTEYTGTFYSNSQSEGTNPSKVKIELSPFYFVTYDSVQDLKKVHQYGVLKYLN